MMKVLRFAEALLFAIGAAAIGVWLWAKADSVVFQAWQSRLFDRQARSSHPARQQSVIGRLTISRLELAAMVREGTGEDTLRVALGHIPGTALPGSPGNVGVAGHRDMWFRALRDVRIGDLIRFETVDGAYLYRVEETQVVPPQDLAVLHSGLRPELTLVTCFPFYYVGAAPQRFIVRARQVDSKPRPTRLASAG